MLKLDHAAYVERCRARWDGPALRNALANWRDFQELRPVLVEQLRMFHRDPCLTDMAEKCHNPDGTLTAFLWKLQESLEPDRSRVYPLLDFCEHYQKVHLRRGLIIYCEQILRALEAGGEPDGKTGELELAAAPASRLPSPASGQEVLS